MAEENHARLTAAGIYCIVQMQVAREIYNKSLFDCDGPERYQIDKMMESFLLRQYKLLTPEFFDGLKG